MDQEELRAAEAHIARLEEEVLRLKDGRRELQQKSKHGAKKKFSRFLRVPFGWWGTQKSERAGSSDYEKWFARHRVKGSEIAALRLAAQVFFYRPLVSVLLPTFNSDDEFLRAAIESVRAQIYDSWELVIVDDGSDQPALRKTLEDFSGGDGRIYVAFEKHGGISAALNSALTRARGQWVALLDHDDLLEPDAIFRAIQLLQNDREADVIYSDEDKIVDGKLAAPMLKPDWAPDFFLTHDYLGHFLMIRRELMADGFRSKFDGAQDYDLLLRISEKTDRIRHIPRVLYHWRRTPQSTAHNIRRKPGALEAGRSAIEQGLTRRGEEARVTIDWKTHLYRVRPAATGAAITIVSGQIDESEIGALTDYPKFNFASSVSNDSWNELVLFLEPGLRPVQKNWLALLVEQIERPQMGAVGARILAADGTVESAGLILLPGGVVKDVFGGCAKDFRGANRQLQAVRNYSALSSACFLTRRSLLEKYASRIATGSLGFARDDGIDFCLRIQQAGWRVVSIPDAELKRCERKPATEMIYPELARRWPKAFASDPFYHPNLSRLAADFSLGE